MPSELPVAACCRKCGYLLRGLPSAVCPECGRTFDLADPKSYSLATPRQRRWRLIRRIAIAAIGVAALVAIAPRSMNHSTLSVSCCHCGQTVTVERYELWGSWWKPPWRWPGFTTAPTTTVLSSSAMAPPGQVKMQPFDATTRPAGCVHDWDSVRLSTTKYWGGSCGGGAAGSSPTINGQRVTPDVLAEIVKSATDPHATGIMFSGIDD